MLTYARPGDTIAMHTPDWIDRNLNTEEAGMARSVRWLIAAGAAVVSFPTALWLASVGVLPFEPRADADRWVVTAAFAGGMLVVVLTAVGWWAGRENPPVSRDAPSKAEPARMLPSEKVPGHTFINTRNKYKGPNHTGSGDLNINHLGNDKRSAP